MLRSQIRKRILDRIRWSVFLRDFLGVLYKFLGLASQAITFRCFATIFELAVSDCRIRETLSPELNCAVSDRTIKPKQRVMFLRLIASLLE